MIKHLEIENYGCIRHAVLKPTPLHGLVGPSDVGKTTVLDAVTTLARFVRIEDQGDPALRIPEKPRDNISLTAEFAGSLGFNVGFAPRSQTLETYVRESMHGAWLGYRHVSPDFRWASEEPPATIEFASQIRDRLDCATIDLQSTALQRDSPLILDRAPVMIGREGQGLAGVYDRIMARGDDSFDRITQQIRAYFPWVGGIEVSTVSPVTKNLFVRTLDGQRVPAKQVGVGVLRMLAWEALRYIDRPRLLLVEEPEAGLSPALIQAVMQILRALTVDAQRQTQVLIATRSPLVVAELDVREITVMSRTAREGTKVAALADYPDYVQAAERLPRGLRWLDLVDSGDGVGGLGSGTAQTLGPLRNPR